MWDIFDYRKQRVIMMIFILYNVILISYYLKWLIFLKMTSSEKQTLHSSITPVALKLQVVLPKN